MFYHYQIYQVTVRGAVVLDCVIFRGVSNILTPHVCKQGGQKIRNPSQCNVVQYNSTFTCDLCAKTYN